MFQRESLSRFSTTKNKHFLLHRGSPPLLIFCLVDGNIATFKTALNTPSSLVWRTFRRLFSTPLVHGSRVSPEFGVKPQIVQRLLGIPPVTGLCLCNSRACDFSSREF